MRYLLWVLAAILLLSDVTSALAADRKLLATQGVGTTLRANPAAAQTLKVLRSKAVGAGSVRVILGLRVPFAAEARLPAYETARQRREIAGARASLQRRLSASAQKTMRIFDNIPFVAMSVTPEDLNALATDPAVLTVTEDRRNVPSLAESVPLIQGTAAWSAGYRGLGQTIAIIDSGVDKSHPFLAGKVVSEACYSSGGWCPGGKTSSTAAGSARPCPNNSECAHGTHVAGIAAGLGTTFSGVAKEANLIAIQVMSPAGKKISAYDSDMIAGLQRVYELRNTYKIAAVNMSLGTDGVYSGACDGVNPAMTAAIETLRSAGIATVIASGNSYAANGISSPACISSAVSVGAVSDSAWGPCAGVATAVDQVPCYSNSDNQLSLLAPGSVITSSVPGGKFASLHGTSMAAPHVAGAWALLKEKAPSASVTSILQALQTTGTPVQDYRNQVTKPRINVKAALDQFVDSRFGLTYSKVGSARGVVTFTPSGTVNSCRSDCLNRFAPGTLVTLTATPDPGVTFVGWAGACSGIGNCKITMSEARSVYAGFFTGNPQILSYTKAGTGAGVVTLSLAGFTTDCATSCTQPYGQRGTVTLTAQPAYGVGFTGWSGACTGSKTICIVRMDSAKSVTAIFDPLQKFTVSYSAVGTGKGSVSFEARDIVNCDSNCSNQYPAGPQLTVTAVPQQGSAFVGWSGASCQGPKQTCIMSVNAAAAISASFRLTAAAAANP